MEDFRVDLGIFLNPENLQTVQSQIDSLSSRNVTLKINTQDVLKDVNLIKQQLKSIGVDFGGTTGVGTAVKKEMAEVEKTVGKTFDIISKETKTKFANLLNSKANGSQLLDFKGIEKDIETTFGKIGTVTTKVVRDAENNIDQFTISVKSKLEGTIGEVEELHYRWKEIIKDNKKTGDFAYSFTSSRATDNNIKLQEEATRKATQAKKEHEAQMQKSQATAIKLRASLNGLKKEYEDSNNARPISSKSQEALKPHYDEILGKIKELETAEKNEYDVAKAQIESKIKSLKLLIEAYRKAENSGTQLRTKPVEVSKIDEEFKLDAYIAKMQRAGIVAQEFWYKINGVNADGTANQNSLKSKLEAVTDTDSLNAYLNLLSNVQAEGKKLIEEKRVNDQQAAQSQENINKVFQRTLELEKQIGQTRVKIAGLDPEKDGAQIAELTNRLNDLKSESQLVKEEFGSTFTTEQVLKLSSVIQETESKIAEVKAQLQDKSAWEQQKQAARESLEAQKQEAREVAKEYNKLLALYKEISSIKERMAKANASGDINTVTALNRELSDLNGKIHEIETNYSQLFSDEQILGAIQILERYEAKLETVNATIQDNTAEKQKKQNTREVNEEYKKLLELLSKIRSLNKSLVGVDSDNSYYKETIQQMLEFKKVYDELYVAVAKKLDVTQVDELREKAEETTRQISLLGAKYEAEINKRINDKADNIKTNFSNGQYEKEVNAVKTSFDGLRNTTTELQTAMNGLDTAYENLKTAQSGSDPQKLVVAEEAYVNALKKVKNQLDINTRTEREQISAEKMAQGKQALYSQIDVWLKNNSAAAKKFGAELREIQAQLKGTDAVDLKALRAQFQETTRQAKILGVTGKSLKDQFSQTFKTLGMYFSSTALIMRGVQYVRQMYDNVLKVDTAMTGLYRVTNLTGEQYAKLYDDMTESAKKYGSTLDDIINSTASWVRLGFDANTAEGLSEVTAMYQHVTDLDNGTAVKNLVTAYKGYQNELLELSNGDSVKAMTRISDIYDKLGGELAHKELYRLKACES